MISKKLSANQPYHPLSTLDSSLGNFRVGVWLICLVLFFSLAIFNYVLAQDNNEANFGEFCSSTEQCRIGLTCASNACVQCTGQNQCGSVLVCQDGICVFPGGNSNGEFCANDSQCLSRNCAEDGTCRAVGDNSPGVPGNSSGNGVLSKFPGEDLQANDVIKIVVGLSCWLTRVAFTLTIIFVILAGFKFMTAQGNQTKYGEAVKNFQTVLWGILVIYGVYVIIATVAHAVGITSFSFIPLVC